MFLSCIALVALTPEPYVTKAILPFRKFVSQWQLGHMETVFALAYNNFSDPVVIYLGQWYPFEWPLPISISNEIPFWYYPNSNVVLLNMHKRQPLWNYLTGELSPKFGVPIYFDI